MSKPTTKKPNLDGIRFADEPAEDEWAPPPGDPSASPPALTPAVEPQTIPGPTPTILGGSVASQPSAAFAAMSVAEQRAANDRAARGVVERMKHLDLANFPSVRPELPPITPAEAAALRPKRYLVKVDRQINRGAGQFILRAGKEISENDYPIADLVRQGVQLDEIQP